jgi:hypothetical protein
MSFEALKTGFETLETGFEASHGLARFEASHGRRGLKHSLPAKPTCLAWVLLSAIFSLSNLVWLFLLSFLTFFLN